MPNTWFRFREFLINQDRCAMKVNTDAVILGASCPVENTRTILDAGTGTGVVALMLAQRSSARIAAIELEPGAAFQAAENFSQSKWCQRLTLIQGDFLLSHIPEKFDLVVSNPPYFGGGMMAPGPERALARQGSGSLERWIEAAIRHCNDEGKIALILPYQSIESALRCAAAGDFHLQECLIIYPRPEKHPVRVMLVFSSKPCIAHRKSLFIRSDVSTYSEAFRDLTRPYYL